MFRPLQTQRLIIRRWQERDRELFHEINSDDDVLRFFPFRRSRKEADEMMDKLNRLIDENGYSFSALELISTGECVGFCGLHKFDFPEVFPNGGTEIGWRLAKCFWGNGYVTEAGFKLLEYGFNKLKLNEIISFAVEDNLPSIAVMQRLGMKADPKRDFEMPNISHEYAHLRPHVFYAISQKDWADQQQ